MSIYAHSLPDRPEAEWEPLADHLSAVAARAAGFAAPFGLAELAGAAGWLHDIGKCSAVYQAYIRGRTNQAKGPDHSSAGAREAIRLYGAKAGRLIAFGIAGHHGGLTNGRDVGGKGRSLESRLDPRTAIEAYDGWQAHAPGLPDAQAIRAGTRLPQPGPDLPGFEKSFAIRMLYSCLVDADWLETERVYAEARHETVERGGALRREHLDRIRAFMAQPRADTPVNRLRAEILDHAVARAALPPGLFTMTVPTGGGKTLASLNFAIDHALRHGLKRIVYVIPYTSIIEQTAQVFRDALGTPDDILEHHSAFDWDATPPARDGDREGEGRDGLAKLRRASENWDVAVVVTTAVQFFESLFSDRRAAARKLHNLAESVIVLDEAQTMPVHLLRPSLAALDELARNYRASVVLCTATQPALRVQDDALARAADGKVWGLHIPDDRELAPRPREMYEELRRVAVERRTGVSDADIAGRFAAEARMLCIVNSRGHARKLFEAIAELPGACHLTTLMCARHRRAVLADVRARLREREPVRLVATSLIEAGVDVDFPEVWRAAAGLDSIAQAAGRCNREGRLEGLGRTIVFEPLDAKVPQAMGAAWDAARPVLRAHEDPLSLDAVRAYFRELYFNKGFEALDAGRIGDDVYPILPAIADTARDLDFPFERIARAYRLIDEALDPVLIPYDADGREALDLLRHARHPPAGVLRRLQQYVVPVPAGERGRMLASGAVQPILPEAYGDRFMELVSPSLYTEALGLRLDDPTWRSAESGVM